MKAECVEDTGVCTARPFNETVCLTNTTGNNNRKRTYPQSEENFIEKSAPAHTHTHTVNTYLIAWCFVVNKMLWFWSRQLRLIAKRLQMCIFFALNTNVNQFVLCMCIHFEYSWSHCYCCCCWRLRHCPLFSFSQCFWMEQQQHQQQK